MWSTDTSIATTTADLFSHIKDAQQKAAEDGEQENSRPGYKNHRTNLLGCPRSINASGLLLLDTEAHLQTSPPLNCSNCLHPH